MSTAQHRPDNAPDPATLTRQIHDLGQWFHNLDLHGVPTAPNHFLGDFPNIKWKKIGRNIPRTQPIGGFPITPQPKRSCELRGLRSLHNLRTRLGSANRALRRMEITSWIWNLQASCTLSLPKENDR